MQQKINGTNCPSEFCSISPSLIVGSNRINAPVLFTCYNIYSAFNIACFSPHSKVYKNRH